MLSAKEKLLKFISLELNRGCDNRAVVGGMNRFLPVWNKESGADEISPEQDDAVRAYLTSYEAMDLTEREAAGLALIEKLGGTYAKRSEGQRRRDSEGSKAPQPRQNPNSGEARPRNGEERNGSRSAEAKRGDDRGERTYRAPQEEKPRFQIRKIRFEELRVNTELLEKPVSVIPGIGPQNSKSMAKQGIHTVRDFLYYFPRRYDDYSIFKKVNQLEFGDVVTIICNVYKIGTARRGAYQVTEAIVGDGTGKIRLTWFNQPWLEQQLKEGTVYVFSGKVDEYLGRAVMNGPDWEATDTEHLTTNRIVPIYATNSQLKQNFLRRMAFNTVNHWREALGDFLSAEIRESARLESLPDAIAQIHFPSSQEELRAARRRLAFDEVFLGQVNAVRAKTEWKKAAANYFRISDDQIGSWTDRLPYRLTDAQWRVLNEMRGDIDSGHPMNRLIQGDVGSGKTIVALLCALIVSNMGGQSVLMAPTGILAEQHYKNLLNLIEVFSFEGGGFNVSAERTALLLGSTSDAEKRRIAEGLQSGEILFVIGTHALLEDPIQFRNLELAIIDEQHRFGVKQRAALRAKGASPHVAVMSATPIPRSLWLTVFGDLDVSIIDQLPPGRIPIETQIFPPVARERAWFFVADQVKKGRQAYIIYPLIESGENSDRDEVAAVRAFERLRDEVFPERRVALLHGKLKDSEKDEIITAFKNHEYDLLISTSVIEVGVDVPNATVMVIEGADRFGLAQLHQFRGRVGRGDAQSYCILIPEKDDSVENDRLVAMTETNDGFELAEKDLEKRGPGDALGTRQSGLTEFKLATLFDLELIQLAREAALKIFTADPELAQEAHQALKAEAERIARTVQTDIS